MKKLLSILICVLFAVPSMWAGNAKITASVSAASTGTGEVVASTSSSTPSSGWTTGESTTNNGSWLSKGQVYAHARTSNTSASEFSHWIIDGNSTSSSNPYSLTANAFSGDKSASVAAVFYKIIDCKTKEVNIMKAADAPKTETFTAEVFKAKNIGIDISKNSGPGTAMITCTHDIADDTKREATFTITAGAGVVEGDVFTITLTGNKGASHTVVVKIFSSIKFYLEAPTVGVGSYTYKRTDGQGTNGTLSVGSATVEIQKEGNEVYQLQGIDDTSAGYRFDKWVITHADGTTTNEFANPYTYDIVNGDHITAEFISSDYAIFKIIGNDAASYNHLDDAIDATGGSGVVYVYQSGKLLSGDYTIPANVTLLIPGDDANTVCTGDVRLSDFVSGATRSAIKCKKYLIMEENTRITVQNKGAISVYAKMSKTQPMNGTPYSYGRLDMGINCHITLEGGSVLSALGYITGNPETSSITAESGALVYEAFQIPDWRGGNATMKMLGVDMDNFDFQAALGALAGSAKNDYSVFPVGQYYVQCIETKLIYKSGSIGKLSTGVGLGDTFGDFAANAPFIVPNDKTNYPTGLFRLGNSTELIKYYDCDQDRQIYIIEGSNKSTVEVDEIELVFPDVNLYITKVDIKVNSSNFVLPINNNMDIYIKNAIATISERLAFMAGSRLNVDGNSECIVAKNQYVYDKKQNSMDRVSGTDTTTVGFYGTANYQLVTVPYTPGNTEYENNTYKDNKSPKKRQSANLDNAQWMVNGKIMVNGGAIYTTSSGADITSEGNGSVYFGKIGTDSVVYQAYQYDQSMISYPAISITNAKLHNDEQKNPDEKYSAGQVAKVDETYTYVSSLGKWLLPQSLLITGHDNGNKFDLTLPQDLTQSIICYVQTENNTITEDNFVITYPIGGRFTKAGEISYDATNKQLSIPLKYAHQDIHNKENPYTAEQLVVKCKDLASGTYIGQPTVITLSATEDYTPKFNVAINGANYTDGSEYPLITGTGVDDATFLPVVITAENTNVAQALVTWNDKSSACTGPFTFEFGAKTDVPFASAMLTYFPTVAGEHEGTLSLTATYKDASNEVQDTTVTIKLKAKVALKQNDLRFATFEKIYNNTPAFELIDATSNNAQSDIDVTLSQTGVVEITGSGTATDPYMVKPIGLGSVTITAVQSPSRIVDGKTISTTITVISSEVYPVPFCVDGLNEFNKRLFGGKFVSYNTTNNVVELNSTSSSSEWIFRFNGTPDKLNFIPTGNNTWNVQQRSSDTDEWKNVVVWSSLVSGEPVSLQLEPITSQIRIQYGSAIPEVGTLSNVCVTELKIAADVEKIYIPIYVDSEKKIVLTHIENADPAITFTDKLEYKLERSGNLGTASAPYYRTTVTIKATANTEEDAYQFTAIEDGHTVSVQVNAYKFPQELPIKLATDAPANGDRYYYVTTESSFAQWDATNRQVVFQNPGSQRTRMVTFAFNGAPSIIRFDASTMEGPELIVDSVWTIEESVDGVDYHPSMLARDSIESSTLVQELNYTTRYVRVKYNSVHTQEIRLSNLVIEGYPNIIVNPENLMFTTSSTKLHLEAIAINLQNVDFVIDNTSAFQMTMDTTFTSGLGGKVSATPTTHETALGVNKVDTIFLGVKWLEKTALDEGTITIINKANDSILTIIPLLGSDSYLIKENADNSGIYTGIPSAYTYHGSAYTDYEHHMVNLTNAFAVDGTAMFDYLFIYGETTPASGDNITAPKKWTGDDKTSVGSNAQTPLIVYKKALNADSEYKGYQFIAKVDNVNVGNKPVLTGVLEADSTGVIYFNAQNNNLRVYMTGFCPYATTGFDKLQEGVFLFRGKHGSKLDIYLEDFQVFSRNKTKTGHNFAGKEGGEIFSDGYARGSGGVLVFENIDPQEQLQTYQPFEVSIHTMGDNLLKSNYGCFFGLAIGPVVAMKATQVSSPIQVHMYKSGYERKTKVTLNFDDLWPTVVDENNEIIDSKRTNGYLGLKKQANNAPSIDLGNKHTTVNFNGGRIELQNSQIGSDTYKTTLAISHRSGYFGSDDAGIQLCYGIGTDSVGGNVNFLDGTITVERMKVDSAYLQYYLLDTIDGKQTVYTSCLRTPKNTIVRGGSICPIRACQHVTSKGGAPKDGSSGKMLGQYVYTMQDGVDSQDPVTKLATIVGFPDNVEGLKLHQQNSGYTYGLNSVTPDANNKLYFWIPDGFGGVTAERDALMSIWKACMTEIGAGVKSVAEGRVGGDTPIEQNEEVKYFLYCQLDENIHTVISKGEGEGDNRKYFYEAPLEVPPAAKTFFKNAEYTRWAPSFVGSEYQHQVLSDTTYTITDRVYYITTATADIWQTFTAPFDVAKIYVVESFSEDSLENIGTRAKILEEQAKYNADFAAFFAVAMAMGTDKSFDGIYQSYRKWATIQDRDSLHIWDGDGDYTPLRSMQELIPYYGNNWRDANFYLNHNDGNWGLTQYEDSFAVSWNMLPDTAMNDGILLHKGETYSLMFPYCTGCENSLERRDYWDYWSGKFLIFESTAAPQEINGRDFLNENKANNVFLRTPLSGEVIVTGNSTFANLDAKGKDIYVYNSDAPRLKNECFEPVDNKNNIIYPTTAFLYGDVPTGVQGMPARKITRSGKIIYDVDNNGDGTVTGGHIPTVGGGNDLFITSTAEGINIAVAEAQHVRVMSATGIVLYNGMVQTAVDVALPTTGVYVITGENEVHKILF